MNMRTSHLALLTVVALMAIMGAWLTFGRHDCAAGPGPCAPSPSDSAGLAGTLPAAGTVSGATRQRPKIDDAYLRTLMRQYSFETELDKRGALLAILQANPNEEVRNFALTQAASSDPATRQEGLELLKAFPLDDSVVRGFLVSQIDKEQDPAMLTKLVDMLTPTMVATEDAAPLVAQLARLRGHPDPEVRAASILQSSQWDRGGDLENTLHEAMLDPDTRVRQAAISGIQAERVHSDRVKDMLLVIASGPKTSGEERNRAIFALESFALNRSEYEIYRQAARLGESGERHEH